MLLCGFCRLWCVDSSFDHRLCFVMTVMKPWFGSGSFRWIRSASRCLIQFVGKFANIWLVGFDFFFLNPNKFSLYRNAIYLIVSSCRIDLRWSYQLIRISIKLLNRRSWIYRSVLRLFGGIVVGTASEFTFFFMIRNKIVKSPKQCTCAQIIRQIRKKMSISMYAKTKHSG